MTTPDRAGRLPLHYAALEGDMPAAVQLLDSGADPNVADRDGFTPLHFAAQESSREVARILIERGARVDSANVHGNTPLFVAVFNSRGEGALIKLLRDAGADPLKENNAGQTPLGLARLIGNYDVSQFFDNLPKD